MGGDRSISNYLNKLNDKTIVFKVLSPKPLLHLGDLRNISIEISRGDYFCVWDDDDWNHMDRLSMQVAATLRSRHPVSALTNLLAFDKTHGKLYFSRLRPWEGTILCKKKLFFQGIKYPSLPAGEDTSFMSLLLQRSKIYPVVSATAYIYIFHGDNTSDLNHFKKNVFQQPLSKKASKVILEVLSKDVATASRLLDVSVVPKELNYFYVHRLVRPNKGPGMYQGISLKS